MPEPNHVSPASTSPGSTSGTSPRGGYQQSLPPRLVERVIELRRAVVARVPAGRVLDLGGDPSHHRLWEPRRRSPVVLDGADDPRWDELTAAGARFDTVVSILQLTGATDLEVTLGRVREVLDDDGTVEFVDFGLLKGLIVPRALPLVAPLAARSLHRRLDRDVPRALRGAGLSVTRQHRHRVHIARWWLRSLVEGSAHHERAPRRSDGGRGD